MTSIAIALVMALAVPAHVVAQQADEPSSVPRTAWGDPDLQGIWSNNTSVPLQRPTELGDRETLSEEEVAARHEQQSAILLDRREGSTGSYNEFWFEHREDTNRTALIIDPQHGRLPDVTPREMEAQAARRALLMERYQGGGGPSSHLDLSVYDRCITRGLPGAMMPGFYNHNYHILQTPDHVALVVEMIHDARIIPLDGRGQLTPTVRQWLGDSRGHWDGDTLVVETTNFNNKATARSDFVPTVFGIGENLKLVERFTRVDAETIDYRFTVEDATVYTAPWTAAIPFNRAAGTLFEYACHEGNYAVPNMLAGARAAEAAAGSTPPR